MKALAALLLIASAAQAADFAGAFRAAGYILRIPEHNGHWIALVPPAEAGHLVAGRALLCDSLYPRPFLLERSTHSSC